MCYEKMTLFPYHTLLIIVPDFIFNICEACACNESITIREIQKLKYVFSIKSRAVQEDNYSAQLKIKTTEKYL